MGALALPQLKDTSQLKRVTVARWRSAGDDNGAMTADTKTAVQRYDEGEWDVERLLAVEPLPALAVADAMRPSGALLAALSSVGSAAPVLQQALRAAAVAGEGLRVSFPPDVVAGLANGSLHLLKTSTGAMATAVDSGGQIVAHARVAGDVASLIGPTGASLTAGAAIAVALPIVIAGAAAYAQQRRLEQALASIQDVVERIEQRLQDADTGVCDAADEFLKLAHDVVVGGVVPNYVRLELAAQRVQVEALYGARRRWVSRFKETLESEQIAREKSKGRGQPWVDSVEDHAKSGRLERELIIFVRALLARTKLGVLASAALAEDGHGAAALNAIDRYETELRQEFFDLHRRLVPLARIEPESSLIQRLPMMGAAIQRAHDTVQVLVEHLNTHVLPIIPDPTDERAVVIDLRPDAVQELNHLVAIYSAAA